MKRKSLVLILAAVVLVLASVGGTLAWLTDSDTVINTFSVGQVDITASEPTWNATGADHKLVPGKMLTKDPKVTVEGGSEKAYVFVKVTASTDVAAVLTYEIADGWLAVTGHAGVFYRVVDSSASDQTFSVLKNDRITVNTSATNTTLAAISNVAAQDYMQISVAAVQFEGTTDAPTAFGYVPAGF